MSPAPDRTARRPGGVLVVGLWLLIVLGGGAAGAAVFDLLSSATDPVASSDSITARHLIETATGESDSIIALVPADVPAPAVADAASRLRALPGVHRVQSSADGQLPAPAGGGTVLVVGVRAGLDDHADNANTDAVRAELDRLPGGEILLGGYPVIDLELGATAEADLVNAEVIALPIVLLLLGLALRSLFGTLLGLALVVTTVTGALAILFASVQWPTCRASPSTWSPCSGWASPWTTACCW